MRPLSRARLRATTALRGRLHQLGEPQRQADAGTTQPLSGRWQRQVRGPPAHKYTERWILVSELLCRNSQRKRLTKVSGWLRVLSLSMTRFSRRITASIVERLRMPLSIACRGSLSTARSRAPNTVRAILEPRSNRCARCPVQSLPIPPSIFACIAPGMVTYDELVADRSHC